MTLVEELTGRLAMLAVVRCEVRSEVETGS